jgi:hypothetical protein
MYPAQISESTESLAERLLFREFQRQLPDDFIVMHSVGWLSRNRKRNFDGEVDFVVVHPNYGVLLLEVKGGTLQGAWSSDIWISTSRKDRRNETRNPIKQVHDSMYALKAKLADNPRTSTFAYPLFRGVAFPDMLVEGTLFGPDFERTLVIDSSDLDSLESAIARMFSAQPLDKPLESEAINGLLELLQPVVRITQLGLLAEFKQGDLLMTQLTEQQFRLLGFLRHHRQVVINGCAGSGKTILAIEKARLLAEQGFQVLLTCYNKNLSEWIQSGIGQLEPSVRDLIRVSNYHDLAVRLCEESGNPSTVRKSDSRYWEVDLPAELEAAIPSLPVRFDAIIADEGQDFITAWWRSLKSLLRDPQGVFYIFQDEQQAIYRRDFSLPISVWPHELGVNCRSTTHIHAKVIEYYRGDPKPESIGPEGRGIEFIDPEDSTVQSAIGVAINRLIQVEGLEPAQIVILTPNGKSRSSLREGDRAGDFSLSWDVHPGADQIRVSSVHAFKGLESMVVILAEPARFTRHRYAAELMYVAISRARHHLIVIGELPALPRVLPAIRD